MSSHHYKGYTIELTLDMEGIMWTCRYVILKLGEKMARGFPDENTYVSPEKAEFAALEKAKSLIDNSELGKDP